jgi:hypothetical protein
MLYAINLFKKRLNIGENMSAVEVELKTYQTINREAAKQYNAFEIKKDGVIKTVIFDKEENHRVYNGSLKGHIWAGYPQAGNLKFSFENRFTEALIDEKITTIDKIADHILKNDKTLKSAKPIENQDIKAHRVGDGRFTSNTIYPMLLEGDKTLLININSQTNTKSYQIYDGSTKEETQLRFHEEFGKDGDGKSKIRVACTIFNKFDAVDPKLREGIASIDALAVRIFNKKLDDEKNASQKKPSIKDTAIQSLKNNKIHFAIAFLASATYLMTFYAAKFYFFKKFNSAKA